VTSVLAIHEVTDPAGSLEIDLSIASGRLT